MLNRQNQQLEKKYKNASSFAEHMDKISQKFKQFEQQAFYSELEESAHKMIISILPHSPLSTKLNNARHISYYIIIGARQPGSIEKIILNIIHLIPRPKETYAIIFINTGAHKDAYNDFMKVTELLPLQYFKHLENIHVLHASFINKAMGWITFNTITGFVKAKTQFYSEFQELGAKVELNQFELLNLFPADIKKEIARHEEYVDLLLNKYAMKLVTMADVMGKQNMSEGYQIQRETGYHKQQHVKSSRQPIFKSTILAASSLEKKAEKRHIEDYEVGQTGAPLPLELLIYYFNERDDMLKVQGIFRKSVSIDDQNQILAELDDRNYNFVDTVTNPHVIANAIKRFTINFLLPVIPYDVFDALMIAKEPTLTPLVVQSIKGLTSLRKKTLLILCEFFMEKVIPKEPDNKMSLKNICIVLAPCIMRAEVISIKDIVYSQKAIIVTSIIFRQFDSIFGDKKARQQSIRISAKRFNKMYLEDRLGRYQQNMEDVELKPASLTYSQNQVIKASQKQQQQRPQSFSSKGQKSDISHRSSEEHEAILKRERKATLCQKISDTIKQELEFLEESQKESKPREQSESQNELSQQQNKISALQKQLVFKTFEREFGQLEFDYPDEGHSHEEKVVPQRLAGVASADARLNMKKREG